MIKFYATDSSQLTGLGYVPAHNVLVIQFNSGKYYRYENVLPDVIVQILFADSVGKAFNALIKSKPVEHPYKEITAEEAFAL